MKQASIILCSVLAGYALCMLQNQLQAVQAKRFSEGYLKWCAPILLSQLFFMNDGLRKNDKQAINGALEDLTAFTLVDCKRAIEISGWSNSSLPRHHQLTLELFEELRSAAKANKVKPIFAPDATIEPDAAWNPFRPPGFKLGAFWKNLEEGK